MLAPSASGPIHRLDSFFDRVFGEDGSFGLAWDNVPVSMWEDDDRIHVEADLPGMTENDVEITVHNGMLSIRGERKPEGGRNYFYNGRSYGRFERVITLPEAVNADDVQGTLKDGVLRLTLPKRPEARPKKITLRTT
ncbi:Hsp20/alpha crystallin family protein [Aquisphaera giovannonii]|nr:Hsp20/alpha crystallin family protein [Aquisphaera giovannonii]